MPNLNTFSAAILAATVIVLPATAGEPGTALKGGPDHNAQVKTRTYNSNGSYATAYAYVDSNTAKAYASANANSQYYTSGSTSYTYTDEKITPNVKHMTVKGPAHIESNNIVCMHQGTEVPCASVPGLADALRAQGLHSIANKLPQVPVTPIGCGAPVHTVPCGHAHGNVYYQQQTHSAPVNSGYGPYGTEYYGAAGTTYGSYVATPPQAVLTPCGQVVGMTCGSIAPISVQLENGTLYAFGGGVGEGVYGEFYGGGGTLIDGGATYSGVTNAVGFHYGNSLNYSYSYSYKGGGKGGHKGGHHGGGKGDHGCNSGCGGHTGGHDKGGKGGYHGGKGGHYGGGKGGYYGGGKGGYNKGGSYHGGKGGGTGGGCGGGC